MKDRTPKRYPEPGDNEPEPDSSPYINPPLPVCMECDGTMGMDWSYCAWCGRGPFR